MAVASEQARCPTGHETQQAVAGEFDFMDPLFAGGCLLDQRCKLHFGDCAIRSARACGVPAAGVLSGADYAGGVIFHGTSRMLWRLF